VLYIQAKLISLARTWAFKKALVIEINMDNKTLKKLIIIFLLLNKNSAYSDSYSLMKILSRWFNIIDFNELSQELIQENFVRCEVINQIGNYTLTENGIFYFKEKKAIFEEQVKAIYPNNIDNIDILFSNLK